MEINSKSLAALKYAANDENLSAQSFEALIKLIFDSFLVDLKVGKLVPKLDTKNLDTFDIPKVELKEITASFYTLIAEFARHNFDNVSVSTFLEDTGFSNQKMNIFSQFYLVTFFSFKKFFFSTYQKEKREIIRLFLSSSTASFPHIVDVNWRLDYIVKENNLERINEPVYLIELQVEKPGETELSKVQFSCTVEQLQDLVFKLKEASKSVERLAQI